MATVILTAFSKEYELVRSVLKYESQFKTLEMSHVEGEIQNQKVQLLCLGLGRLKARESFLKFAERNTINKILILGYCGGLDFNTCVGDIFMPSIFCLDPRIQPKPNVQSDKSAEFAKMLNFKSGTMVTSDHVISDTSEKQALSDLSKSQVVDMESFDIVEHCFFEEIPFFALKGVIDDSKTIFKTYNDLEVNIKLVDPPLQKALQDFMGALS